MNMTNSLGYTALMVASIIGSIDAFKKLIENGADVNIENNAGQTALFFATQEGHKNSRWEKEQTSIRDEAKEQSS